MSAWPVVEFPDVELLLTGWLKSVHPGVFVGNRLRTHNSRFSIVVRDDSGADGLITAQRRVALRFRGVIGDVHLVSALARRTAALMRGLAETPGPIAAVGTIFGPYRTEGPDSDFAEYYLTAELTVVGHEIT